MHKQIKITGGNMKVYCNMCKFFLPSVVFFLPSDCGSPENIKFKYSWWGKTLKYTNLPRKLNKDNNCPHYKEAT